MRRGVLVRMAVGVVALALLALSVWQLERDRAALSVAPLAGTGTTPATVFARPDAGPAPVVVIAHGFAGSRQLMDSWALTLARAGYIAVTFDFMGHGRNPVPMSGDVTSVDGTTQLLMDELARVADAALALPGADGRLALVGHSMASDIVVRQAVRDPRVQAVVGVSMFSQAVTAMAPRNLLVIPGAWEGMLRAAALDALRLADPEAEMGQTVGDPAAGTGRRAVAAPGVEHVGVLWSATALRETRAWLDASFGRASGGPVPERGGWIALMLVSVTALGWPLARLLPRRAEPPQRPTARAFVLAALLPAVAVPLVLSQVDTRFLSVLVADYLAVHFAVYGIAVLVLLRWQGAIAWPGAGAAGRALVLAVPVAAYGVLVVGGLLDRHVAAFWPPAERLGIVAVLVPAAALFFLGDACLTEGGRAGWWRVLAARLAFLGSLGLAVALDFERLFFLLIILPVILLFFVLFGTMGGWVGRRTRSPAAVGLGLGVFLGWALAVTFPMFAS